MALLVSLLVIFLTILITQYLTFAHITAIFSMTESGQINTISFLLSLSCICVYFLFFRFLFYIDYLVDGSLSNFSFQKDFLIYYFLTPFVLSCVLQKVIFYFFFYATTITQTKNPNHQQFKFFSRNIFRNVTHSVFNRNGLALIYLFRVYSVTLTTIFSMIFFFYYNVYSFFFTSNDIITFCVYKDENSQNLKYLNIYLLLLIVYQLTALLYFYSYPIFNKHKQIYDSIFILYDLKSIQTLEVEKTCEKEAFESEFVKDFVNFDTQSYYFYERKHFDERIFPNFTEVSY